MSNPRGRGRGVAYKKINQNYSAIESSPCFLSPNAKVQNSYNNESTTSVQQNSFKADPCSSSKSSMIFREICLDMDSNTDEWFQQLKKYFAKFKKGPLMQDMLFKFFENCTNPFEKAIILCYNCLDFRDAKPKSMSYLIMEEFREWTNKNRHTVYNLLTLELKIFAFSVVIKQHNIGLTKLVIEIYEIEKDSKHFLNEIRCMIANKQYKEASQCALLLKLQNEFNVEDFLIPLVLQDKLVVVDEFLLKSPKHQIELVSYLDNVLGHSCNVRAALEPIILKLEIPEIKMIKLHYKPWRKLIARLIKMFNVSMEYAPHLVQKRNKGALQFLINKRYIEDAFSDESWKEMVHEAVKDDESLQQELIVQVSIYGDVAEALRWAHIFNIDRSYWPQSVRLYEDDPKSQRRLTNQVLSEVQEEEWWDNVPPPNKSVLEYHQLKLPSHCVHLVDTPVAFERFLDHGLKDVNLIGVDCEWKPSFGVHFNELSVMQIATRDAVFILDIIKLGSRLSHLWQEFGEIVFNNCDILKLGFGFATDLTIIKHSLPHLTTIHNRIGFLDLMSLWKHLEKNNNIKFPFVVKEGGPSLATLVNLCLGKALDKSDQFSNWENRPLRDSQIKYAALDAYCLIEVYDVIKNCCLTAGFPFHEICFQVMSSTKDVKKKTKKSLTTKKVNEKLVVEQPPSPHFGPCMPQSVKIVCDTMLQGLGKSLRRCGVDTVMLENQNDHKECVKIAQTEKRYIVTKGTAFNMLVKYVPPGHCLKVISDDVDEQLREVLDFYKIEVTKNDVFSRCQMCNSNDFVKVSKSTMNALVESFKNPCVPPKYNNLCEEHLENEASGFSSSDEDYYDEGLAPPVASTRKWNNYNQGQQPYRRWPVQPPIYQPSAASTRKWDLCSDEKVDVGLCLTRFGVKILVNVVPQAIIDKTDLFYVCENCGKVYWDGSHLEKVLSNRLQNIVKK